MACGGLGGLGGGGGGLAGWVSGGLHQGVPRVPPLDIFMAVQGSLKPRHHRLESRPVPLGKQQARGGGRAESSPFAFVALAFPVWLPAIRYLVPAPTPAPVPPPLPSALRAVASARPPSAWVCGPAPGDGSGPAPPPLPAAPPLAPAALPRGACLAGGEPPPPPPPPASATRAWPPPAPPPKRPPVLPAGALRPRAGHPTWAASLGDLRGWPTLPLDPPLLELRMEEASSPSSSPPSSASRSTNPPTPLKCLRCSFFARVNIWSQA